MRNMTPYELDQWYRRGRWPCCNGTGYLAGPRGGLMQNIKCKRCGTVMNVIDPEQRRYWGTVGLGQMIELPAGYQAEPSRWTRIVRWRIWDLFRWIA